MKSIGNKAAEFLRKAVGALRGKAAALRARLLFLASPRRRTAVVAGISRHIRALAPRHQEGKQGREKAAAQCSRGAAAVAPAAEGGADDGEDNINHVVVGLTELARLFEQVANEDGVCYADDWALTPRLLFDDEGDERRSAARGGFAIVYGLDVDDDDDDEPPSVIDVIRSRREGDGLEFRIEDEIDHAADMYIARVRRRIMNAQTELGASGIEYCSI